MLNLVLTGAPLDVSSALTDWLTVFITYLRFDQDEINEEYDEVMLDIFVTEAAAVLAHRQSDVVSSRLVTCALPP